MGMMDVAEMKRIFRVKRFEFLARWPRLLGVLTFGILQGVVIGVALSIIWLVASLRCPTSRNWGENPTPERSMISRSTRRRRHFPG